MPGTGDGGPSMTEEELEARIEHLSTTSPLVRSRWSHVWEWLRSGALVVAVIALAFGLQATKAAADTASCFNHALVARDGAVITDRTAELAQIRSQLAAIVDSTRTPEQRTAQYLGAMRTRIYTLEEALKASADHPLGKC